MKINIFLLVVFTCLEPPVVQHLQPYLCSPDPTLIVQNNHFHKPLSPSFRAGSSASASVTASRPSSSWSPPATSHQTRQDLDQMTKTITGTKNHNLNQEDQDLQLLHQAWDLPQLHGRDSPGEGTAVDDGMQGRGAYLWEGEVLIFNY